MVKYYKDDPQPLGVLRKGTTFFSQYDVSLLTLRHQTVRGRPWNNRTT
jgi:hypothetical protein